MFLRRLFQALSFINNPCQPLHTSNNSSNPISIVITPSNINKYSGKCKRDQIPKTIRDTVWIKYHGNKSEGICYACGNIIQRHHAGWHCSHVLSFNKGGNLEIDNLRTCCQHCNLSMGNQNLYTYIHDKKLTGPGSKNVYNYLLLHPSQRFDKRTNNWNKRQETPYHLLC